MLGRNGSTNGDGKGGSAISLLTIVGESARIEGKFDIADSIEIECEIGGEPAAAPHVGGREKSGAPAHRPPLGAGAPRPYPGTTGGPGAAGASPTRRGRPHS